MIKIKKNKDWLKIEVKIKNIIQFLLVKSNYANKESWIEKYVIDKVENCKDKYEADGDFAYEIIRKHMFIYFITMLYATKQEDIIGLLFQISELPEELEHCLKERNKCIC